VAVRHLFACAAAGIIALAPAGALAQTDPERPSLRLGPIEFKPGLAFTNVGVDNNVFNEATNPKRDFTFTASPDLEMSVHPGRLRVAYTTRSDFVYFHKYTAERSVNPSLSGRADLDLGWLKPFASAGAAHTSARSGSEIDLRARHHPRVYSAGTSLKLASRSSFVFTARRATDTYDQGLDFRGATLATSLDNKTTAYESSFNVALTPFTTVGLATAREQQRFDHSPVRNADSIRVGPTVTFSPLGLITGTASVGYRRFNGLDPALADYSGFVATGGIGVLFAGQYRLDTTFTRDVRYSYEDALPYYIVSGGRATLAVQTFGPLDVRVTGGRESMSYRALSGATPPGGDRLIVYGGGAGYRIGDRGRLVVELELSHRTSERDASREYRNHRIVATLNWGASNR
jgi:hypothetical protein